MKFNKNEFGWKEKVSVNTDELVTKNDIPHYNEILITEISGDDYRFFRNNNYFNMSALNLDETKSYIGKDINITDDEEYTFKFVYYKEADALMYGFVYIHNHKSYNGTSFIEDENSAVLTFDITPTPMTMTPEYDGYFKLYEVEKLELDNNCLPDNVSIPNSLTVGTRIGDIGEFSVSEGDENTASGNVSHAEGAYTTASGNISHAEGGYTTASGDFSHAECDGAEASGVASHAEGKSTTARGDYSHAEGNKTTSLGDNSHIEGSSFDLATNIIQDLSSSTSNDDILTAWNDTNGFSLAKGESSHVEGKDCLALGESSHAEGNYAIAIGVASHVEGMNSKAKGGYSHAEGNSTKADGMCSHAEGNKTTASGDTSHAEGSGTIASSENQHVQGKYNIEDTENKYAHIVGNGKYNYNTEEEVRSNAHTLDWQGNGWYKGKLSQDGIPTEDKDLTTKKYVDDKVAGVNASTITGLATVATSGSYNDLTNKPIIPSIEGLATETYVNNKLSSMPKSLAGHNGAQVLSYIDKHNILERENMIDKAFQVFTSLFYSTSIPVSGDISNLSVNVVDFVNTIMNACTEFGEDIFLYFDFIFDSPIKFVVMPYSSNNMFAMIIDDRMTRVALQIEFTGDGTGEYTKTSTELVTSKYVDDTIASQPQISFNDSGELVVTINGVTKTFVPKQ